MARFADASSRTEQLLAQPNKPTRSFLAPRPITKPKASPRHEDMIMRQRKIRALMIVRGLVVPCPQVCSTLNA